MATAIAFIRDRGYWSASWRHHPVDANVVPNVAGTLTVSVRLAG